jgi:hypothetical protein
MSSSESLIFVFSLFLFFDLDVNSNEKRLFISIIATLGLRWYFGFGYP